MAAGAAAAVTVATWGRTLLPPGARHITRLGGGRGGAASAAVVPGGVAKPRSGRGGGERGRERAPPGFPAASGAAATAVSGADGLGGGERAKTHSPSPAATVTAGQTRRRTRNDGKGDGPLPAPALPCCQCVGLRVGRGGCKCPPNRPSLCLVTVRTDSAGRREHPASRRPRQARGRDDSACNG